MNVYHSPGDHFIIWDSFRRKKKSKIKCDKEKRKTYLRRNSTEKNKIKKCANETNY